MFVVWQSILKSDWAKPGPGIVRRIHDTRARQYWDAKNIVPKLLGERLQSDKEHPQPECCFDANDTPWDLVAVYPAGARWETALPRAVFVNGAVVRVKAGIQKALDETR